MDYDSRVLEYENEVSYGTLGIMNSLALIVNQPVRYDLFLINIQTIVRNCLSSSKDDKKVIDQVNKDFESLLIAINSYAGSISVNVLIYMSNSRPMIPKKYQRTATNTRARIESVLNKITGGYGYTTGVIEKITRPEYQSLNIVAAANNLRQPYRYIPEIMSKLNYTKGLLLSHCPIDFIMLSMYKRIKLMESHTGRIIDTSNLGKKVFKEDIPFYKTTLRLFGDKDNITPLIKNRPRALKQINNKKLYQLSEQEIKRLALSTWNIPASDLRYVL